MKNNVIAFFILTAVALGGFFSIYFRKDVVPVTPPASVQPQKTSVEPLRIGILGESRSDGSEELSFNQEILSKLFDVLDQHQAKVIFFTGDLTLGWSKPGQESKNTSQTINGKDSEDPLTNTWLEKGYSYDPTIFGTQLKQFHLLFKNRFKEPIALYPIMGSHEAIGPDAKNIFEKEFHIKGIIPDADDQLGYTVSIGNAFFALIPTNYYDNKKHQIINHTISPETIAWLKSVLKEAKLTHRYLFVIGHEPAYSTPSIFNKNLGLNLHAEQRDSFWNTLKENGVLAYFTSHEHVYDRSNRDGVWQVISGGGGSPLNQGGENNHAFFHSLLLVIPQNEKGVPSVTVLDKDGNVRDFFELNQGPQALHQFRISMS